MSACSTEELVLPSAPSAFAGFDRASVFGAPIVLDASLSSDPDGDVLSYSWRLAAQPAGSTARIEDLDARLTQLVPDRLGTYVISLLASDGYLTGRDLVAITVTASAAAPQRPELELSPRAQNVVLSDEPIVIDASAAPNAYFLRTPSGVSADTVLEVSGQEISFLASRPGEYWIAAQARTEDAISAPVIATVLVSTEAIARPRAGLLAPSRARINDRILFDARTSTGTDPRISFELLTDPSNGVDRLLDVGTGCPPGVCRTLQPSTLGTYVVRATIESGGVTGASALSAVEVER